MMNKIVYYDQNNGVSGRETIKGRVVAVNGDRCVVRHRTLAPRDGFAMFAPPSYEDVDRIVKIDDLIIEGFDDEQSYINGIRTVTGTKMTNAKIIATSLRLIVKLVGYGVPLKDDEIAKIGRVYALGYFNNKSVDMIKLDELDKALKKDAKKRARS